MSKAVRVDMFGREIAIGDFIIYPSSLGRSATLMIAEVVSFSDNKKSWETEPDKRLYVRAISQYHGGKIWRRDKVSLLNFPERGLIIAQDALPRECLEALETVPDPKQ